jgi:hypothetical protein
VQANDALLEFLPTGVERLVDVPAVPVADGALLGKFFDDGTWALAPIYHHSFFWPDKSLR